METFTQHFVIEGRYYGSCLRRRLPNEGNLVNPTSYTYVCPECGDVWAKAFMEGRRYCIINKRCRLHPHEGYDSIYDIAGSLLFPHIAAYEKAYNEGLPVEVMRWEVERHLDWWEKQQ